MIETLQAEKTNLIIDNEMSVIEPKIISLRSLIENKQTAIPEYQRPYKWSVKNVNQLIDDILHFKNTSAYRLGTIVYHREDKKLYIVDGQQRSVTIALVALAISNDDRLKNLAKVNRLELPKNTALENFEFNHPVSKDNIRTNYREIQRRIKDIDYKTLHFFFNNCEVVKVVLNDISEAFQFFDSQNARGIDLDPHDLLKAFHLREIDSSTSEQQVKELVANWEDLDSDKLVHSFSNYLFRIRHWSKGKPARFFTKSNVDEFKGVSPNVTEPFPYAGVYRIVHFYLEGYNGAIDRKIDGSQMNFPFQLDQIVINGQRFFEMIQHYIDRIEMLDSPDNLTKKLQPDTTAYKILKSLNTYQARVRTGDKYVRNLFNAALIYYIDKFGFVEIERAIEKIFLWAYKLRLQQQVVQLASMDNHALEYPFIFKTLREVLHPSEFLNIPIEPISESDFEASNRTGKLDAIVQLFRELNYVI